MLAAHPPGPPARSAGVNPAALAAGCSRPGGSSYFCGRMQKILVIDDEPSMRELLAIMLRKEGF